MALPVSIIALVAPEFAEDERAADFLAMAEAAHTASVFAAMYSYAMAYYAAHMMATTPTATGGENQVVGPLTSRKAGDVSRSWGAVGQNEPGWAQWLATTVYGQRYLQILRSRARTSGFVVPL